MRRQLFYFIGGINQNKKIKKIITLSLDVQERKNVAKKFIPFRRRRAHVELVSIRCIPSSFKTMSDCFWGDGCTFQKLHMHFASECNSDRLSWMVYACSDQTSSTFWIAHIHTNTLRLDYISSSDHMYSHWQYEVKILSSVAHTFLNETGTHHDPADLSSSTTISFFFQIITIKYFVTIETYFVCAKYYYESFAFSIHF